ncbi:unnamed protein product [Arctogadus glacialis]
MTESNVTTENDLQDTRNTSATGTPSHRDGVNTIQKRAVFPGADTQGRSTPLARVHFNKGKQVGSVPSLRGGTVWWLTGGVFGGAGFISVKPLAAGSPFGVVGDLIIPTAWGERLQTYRLTSADGSRCSGP